MFLFYFTLFYLWILVSFCFVLAFPVQLIVCFYFQFFGLFLKGKERYKKTETELGGYGGGEAMAERWEEHGNNRLYKFLNQKFKKEKWFTVFLSRYARES